MIVFIFKKIGSVLHRIYRNVYEKSTPKNWKILGDCILWGMQGPMILEFTRENHTAGIVCSIIGIVAKFITSIPVKYKERKTPNV